MKIKQSIQIGNNVTDIMNVPMIKKCEKADWGGKTVLIYYLLSPTGVLVPAQKGHWLVEDENGYWNVVSEEEYNRIINDGE